MIADLVVSVLGSCRHVVNTTYLCQTWAEGGSSWGGNAVVSQRWLGSKSRDQILQKYTNYARKCNVRQCHWCYLRLCFGKDQVHISQTLFTPSGLTFCLLHYVMLLLMMVNFINIINSVAFAFRIVYYKNLIISITHPSLQWNLHLGGYYAAYAMDTCQLVAIYYHWCCFLINIQHAVPICWKAL